MSFTIFGSAGFIGSNLLKYLTTRGVSCKTPGRNDQSVFHENLGHVIYCIGLTSDFRERPFDTVEAHISYLSTLLKNVQFESFLYLSSTRVYLKSETGLEEEILRVEPLDCDDVYNLSKMMGESLCLQLCRPSVRVVSLSNVYGENFDSRDFLFSIIRDAIEKRKVILHTTLASAKDYVSIKDVVRLLPEISLKGQQRIYNVASGVNTKNEQLVSMLQAHTGCEVVLIEGAKEIVFPQISIERIKREFYFKPKMISDSLQNIILKYRNLRGNNTNVDIGGK